MRRMFAKVIAAGEPAYLDLVGIDAGKAIHILKKLSAEDAIRVCGDPGGPLDARYILTATGQAIFRPRWWHFLDRYF